MLKPTLPKFYVNSQGCYLGSISGIQKLTGIYEDGTQIILHPGQFPEIPEGSIEVLTGPDSANQVWDFKKKRWSDLPADSDAQ